ncbi:conserved hypothetical protein [Thermotomaculum hydrothermale]|uniref:Thymidylate synthase (FAD) n=1 Tax=Thermotomaculum hydrothermale TaxID=981385 RepID=A0A7R6PEC2_9BACT|nr:FAD-dependent thymidylate synthase [Thermotomaculum hydrothermale]BBB32179.1 conserved hypothetical protein [Thermotomaculum hydrothermale]
MKVILAGYNVDIDLIESAKKSRKIAPEQLTPETISAAYARISRSSKDVNLLRKEAREDVEKARKSNENIVFGLGHSSVAEHACFNFDIIGISRYATEFLENFRLASYTEKSQRYVKIGDEKIVPKEFSKSPFNELFTSIVNMQYDFYNKAYQAIETVLIEEGYDRKEAFLMAKEDARYALPLATKGQLGMTVNGRELEYIIQRLQAERVEEVKELGKKLYEEAYYIAPSLIKYTEPEEYHKLYPELKKKVVSLVSEKNFPIIFAKTDVYMVDNTPNPDEEILTSILFSHYNVSYQTAKTVVSLLSFDEKKSLFLEIYRNLKPYHSLLREFERASFTFQITLSASAFAQLKRHRIATILKQNYSPSHGVTIPETFEKANLVKEFENLIAKTNEIFYRFMDINDAACYYILTNAHKRRVLFTVNARELYHFVRLREDKHAQWDIRSLAEQILIHVKQVAPLTFMLACGKDKFDKVYREVFGS